MRQIDDAPMSLAAFAALYAHEDAYAAARATEARKAVDTRHLPRHFQRADSHRRGAAVTNAARGAS